MGDVALAWTALGMLLAFAVGAACIAALLDVAFAWRRARYTPVLLAEGAVLAIAAGLASRPLPHEFPRIAGCLAFAMGMQNAVVTRFSGAVVRTTHITGVITDLGMEIWALLRGAARRAVTSSSLNPSSSDDMRAALLHLGLLTAFVLGAIGGGLTLLIVLCACAVHAAERGHSLIVDSAGTPTGATSCTQPSTRPMGSPPPSGCGSVVVEQSEGARALQVRSRIAEVLRCVTDQPFPRSTWLARTTITLTVDASGRVRTSTADGGEVGNQKSDQTSDRKTIATRCAAAVLGEMTLSPGDAGTTRVRLLLAAH